MPTATVVATATPGSGGTLSVSVTTDKSSYVNREQAVLTASVSDGANPVEGAAVQIVITAPKSTLSCNPTTNSSGVASCKYKVNAKRDGTGTYTVDATASKSGYSSGSSSTTFTVS